MPVQIMDVNGNVSDEKKTWWQVHRLKVLLGAVLIVAVIIFLIWFIAKTDTIPSQNSTQIMKKKTFSLLNFSPYKLIKFATKRSMSHFVFDSFTYSSRRSPYSEYLFSRSRFVQLSLFIDRSCSMVFDAY